MENILAAEEVAITKICDIAFSSACLLTPLSLILKCVFNQANNKINVRSKIENPSRNPILLEILLLK